MMEKRKQAFEENKVNRQKELAAVGVDDGDDALERLIAGLHGDTITRKARRRRPGAGETTASNFAIETGNDASYVARDMLAQLQSQGFVAQPSPTISTAQRRRRRRTDRLDIDKELPISPLATEILEAQATSTGEESQDESIQDTS